MWRRIYRQRRRLVLTPLLSAPFMALANLDPGGHFLFELIFPAITVTLVTLGLILVWPSARRITVAFVAVAVMMAVFEWTPLEGYLPFWADSVLLIATALGLPWAFFKLLNMIPGLPAPPLSASAIVPLDPETTLERYTGRDGTVWSPALLRIDHRQGTYDQVYREGVFGGMTARYLVNEYVPGVRERTTVHHMDAPDLIGASTADVTIEVAPAPGGSRITLTEKTKHLANSYLWGAWLDDTIGANLDHFVSRMKGERDRSTMSVDYRANGIDLDPQDQVF